MQQLIAQDVLTLAEFHRAITSTSALGAHNIQIGDVRDLMVKYCGNASSISIDRIIERVAKDVGGSKQKGIVFTGGGARVGEREFGDPPKGLQEAIRIFKEKLMHISNCRNNNLTYALGNFFRRLDLNASGEIVIDDLRRALGSDLHISTQGSSSCGCQCSLAALG